ncbi:ABC transporter ATP-binding protein [Marinobacter nanhaiticus D15-8W]|uniref:ABC transporter ATP-binding protein n=1 Tax=Marinobacter nanhaiticus D15-8W TaxID=626887 RepID=N6WRF6_9GAMM|nr:ABC transporter ATP-binding protein [Marinobacter nanhaiticus]ENO14146.1 ABC transporter ATP-binding protein [Marinobacter nanhaiticus D15-8W]BES71530.1 ABC transporter ATP-binding protein [Marinobacter nanhaiticus D15-8W]
MNPQVERAFVRMADVGHRYDPSPDAPMAVQDINLEIHRHEFVAVVGPSGCGKSTLLRMVSGLLVPSHGEVSVFGKPVDGPRDDVGIVFQKPTLLPWLNVRKNILFPLKHKYGRYSRADEKRAEELLAIADLEAFGDKMPDELSGGMQQRVGIVRALLLNPDILLMDEPFSALDAMTREQIGFDLLKIWDEQPKTVLFITHSISEAVLLADRVLVMSKRPGTVLDLIDVDLERPRTAETINHPRFGQLADRIRKHIYEPEAVV